MTTMNIPRKHRQPPEQDPYSVSPKSEAAFNLNIGEGSFDPLTRPVNHAANSGVALQG